MLKRKFLFRLFFLLICANAIAVPLGSAEPSDIGYVKPKPIKKEPPSYPKKRLKLAQAGMVEVEMMIDKDGKVFEPVAIDSSHPGFEDAAIRAASLSSYSPATLNGEPVESRTDIRILFLVSDVEDAVGSGFAREYRRVRKLLSNDHSDQELIKKKIDKMAELYGLSMYGLAHLNFAKSIYAQRYSSKGAHLDALRKILLFEGKAGEKGKFLDDDIERNVRMNILNLEVKLGHYGDAFKSYSVVKRKFPDAAIKASRMMDDVTNVVRSDKPFSSTLTLNRNGNQLVRLIKGGFAFLNVSSEIKELKIRCTRKFAKLEFQPESEYAIPESWGGCYLEVIGEPKSSVDLIQF